MPKDLTPEIRAEISRALELLRVDRELQAIVASWDDTLPDQTILEMFRVALF
jgi:hypothetical protein